MTWPIRNILNIVAAEKGQTLPVKKTTHWASELIQRHIRLSSYLLVTYLSYTFTFPIDAASKGWHINWISIIIFRNLFLMLFFVHGWHWYLYERISQKPDYLKSIKFNKKNQYANNKQHLNREQIYTTLGFLMSSLYEIIVIRLWATKHAYIQPYYLNFWEFPIWSIFQILFVGYWRDLHFYAVHRFMHPHRFKLFGYVDVGQWMYTNVHSLHHKSHNPGPWSGLSMHPIEHLLYYTCTLLNFVFVLHPFHFLYNKFHADLSPIAGHDGHDKPAGGSLFHYLHHAHFECNYGTPMVPLDVFFGTYVSTEEQWKENSRIKKEQRQGKKGGVAGKEQEKEQ